MLVQFGQRTSSEDVVDLLSECHARIRKFLDLAARLAAAPDSDAGLVQDGARQVHRYFVEAFPLHLADEDELVIPALASRSPGLDATLAHMHSDHVDHAPLVAQLIALCAELQSDPRQLAARASQLAGAAAALSEALEPHLVMEERDILPALRELPQATRDQIKAAMRARRDGALSAAAQTLRR